jgi:DNA polymerase-3 subunit epsilon
MLAVGQTGLSIEQWLVRVNQPIHPAEDVPNANPEGPLYGEVLVFTGALSMVRHDAAVIAANAGCQVDDSVTKHTTLLVVGDQDIRSTARRKSLLRKGNTSGSSGRVTSRASSDKHEGRVLPEQRRNDS